MTTLTEAPGARMGLRKTLSATYQRMTVDQIDEVVRLLGDRDAELTCAGLDRHILSEQGKWPPSAGQILTQMRAIEDEQQRQRPHPLLPSGKGWVLADLSRLPEVFRGIFEAAPRVWPNRCRDCADTGMARFYYDPEKPRKRVYTATEALDLPGAMFARLRCRAAVCDCETGILRPERGLLVDRYPSGDGGQVLAWPHMEDIRELARCRGKW